MRKVFIFAAIVSLSFITLYLPSPFQPVLSAKELTIGINTPLSGAAAPTGLGVLTGLGTLH